MVTKERENGFSGAQPSRDNPYDEETRLFPVLFRHNELTRLLTSAAAVDRKKLVNILNYLHFIKKPLYVLLKHCRYHEESLVRVRHEPCLGDGLTCRWDQAFADQRLEQFRLRYLVVPHEQSLILAAPQSVAADSAGLNLALPESGLVINERRTPRFHCRDVDVELLQHGFRAEGRLVDVSHRAFRITLHSASPASFSWFNAEEPATLKLSAGVRIFYGGECTCLHQEAKSSGRDMVLIPVKDTVIRRFKAKVFRNPRVRSTAPLHVIFEHPLTKRQVQRQVFDISTAGISFYDNDGEAALIPGLIIPEATIDYAGVLRIQGALQVVYRRQEAEAMRFGCVMLDMNVTNYKNLNRLVDAIDSEKTGISNEVDPDALWEFFFDADFIYPQKYKYLLETKDDFRSLFRKLYSESPEIANHFVYQKNGRILGHIAMLRAYERTWMVHHHAARPLGGRSAGLTVLKQLIVYLNDLYRMPSANLNYVITYYRPGNRFPDRIFGGFVRDRDDPRQASLDEFTYLTVPVMEQQGELSEEWEVRECSLTDLWECEQFYRHTSGGLLWSILMPVDRREGSSLSDVYERSGFLRRWRFRVLVRRGEPQAFFVVEESDVGINLSNLLHGFKVLVLNPELPLSVLSAALRRLAGESAVNFASLLVYPASYGERLSTVFDTKRYLLWILNMEHANEYIDYLGRTFRIRLFPGGDGKPASL